VLARPSALGWIVLLWLMLWLADRQRWRATRRIGLYAVTLGVLLLPWGLRNHARLGAFAWLSTNGGVTLYDAQGPQADGSSNQAFLQDMPQLAGMGEVERDRTLGHLAIQQMEKDPARVLRLAGVKFVRTWSFVPNFQEYQGGATAAVSAAFTAVVLAFAVVGLFRAARGRGSHDLHDVERPQQPSARLRPGLWFHVLLWLPVLYFTLVHCLYIGSLRYRIPLMAFLELAAAAALIARHSRDLSRKDAKTQS
jgi:hypothetical protein